MESVLTVLQEGLLQCTDCMTTLPVADGVGEALHDWERDVLQQLLVRGALLVHFAPCR